jgi:hypothetical protein
MKRALSLFAATTLASTFAWGQWSAPVTPPVQGWPAGARAVQVRYRQQGQTIPPLGDGLPVLAPVQKPQMLEPLPVPAVEPDATPGYGVPVMSNSGGVQVIPESEVGQYQDNLPHQDYVPMEGVSRPPAMTPSRRTRHALPPMHATSRYGRTDGLVVTQPGDAPVASGSYGEQGIPMMGDAVIAPSNRAAEVQAGPKGIDLPGMAFDPNTLAEPENESAPVAAGGMEIEPLGAGILPAPAVVARSMPVAPMQTAAPSAEAGNAAGPFTTPAEALQQTRPPAGANVYPMPGQQEYAQGVSDADGVVTPESYAASLRQVSMDAEGSCQMVHPGDLVHFTLRIDNVEDAHHVFTHLQLALNGHAHSSDLEFPIPMHDAMGGGGLGQRDPMSSRVYHFSFVVPEVQSGFYRTTGIDVRASFMQNSADPGVGVPLDRRSREQVRSYCLAVSGGGGRRPVVTDFRGGPVERAANGGSVFR